MVLLRDNLPAPAGLLNVSSQKERNARWNKVLESLPSSDIDHKCLRMMTSPFYTLVQQLV